MFIVFGSSHFKSFHIANKNHSILYANYHNRDLNYESWEAYVKYPLEILLKLEWELVGDSPHCILA